jgi:hypothetical protein
MSRLSWEGMSQRQQDGMPLCTGELDGFVHIGYRNLSGNPHKPLRCLLVDGLSGTVGYCSVTFIPIPFKMCRSYRAYGAVDLNKTIAGTIN